MKQAIDLTRFLVFHGFNLSNELHVFVFCFSYQLLHRLQTSSRSQQPQTTFPPLLSGGTPRNPFPTISSTRSTLPLSTRAGTSPRARSCSGFVMLLRLRPLSPTCPLELTTRSESELWLAWCLRCMTSQMVPANILFL